MKGKVFFVSGIDTNCGKTMVTGAIARELKKLGKKVMTMKLVQTGCKDISEDILVHRKLMGEELNEFDKNGTSCPYVFELPASPHLAAANEGRIISNEVLRESINDLSEQYEIVLLEGAGGLMVPIRENYYMVDFARDNNLPIILISSSRLGSINHSLLSYNKIKEDSCDLAAGFYNVFDAEHYKIINDSEQIIWEYQLRLFPDSYFSRVSLKDLSSKLELDFTIFV
ncbi:MAG: dethiobiotin synthase [Marinilabiliales bacterium]|nr:MAG: dethiobiotin synthase [Marinilabiliales bacterium]